MSADDVAGVLESEGMQIRLLEPHIVRATVGAARVTVFRAAACNGWWVGSPCMDTPSQRVFDTAALIGALAALKVAA